MTLAALCCMVSCEKQKTEDDGNVYNNLEFYYNGSYSTR